MNRKIGVVLSYIMMIFEVFSTLLITPLIIRTLGQAEYGVYKLIYSVSAYLLLLDLGVGNSVTRYIAKYRAIQDREQEEKFFGVTIIYYILITLVTIIFGDLVIFVIPQAFAKGLTVSEIELAQKLLVLTIANAAVTLGTSVFNNVIIAYEKFSVSKGISIFQIIARMILTALVVVCGLGSLGILAVNLFVTVLGRSICIMYVFTKIKLFPQFKGIHSVFVKEVVIYSSLIFLQMIATQLNSSADQILIGAFVSSSASIVAVYSVGSQIVQYFQSIGGAFNGVLMPGIVSMVERDATEEEYTSEMIRIGRIIFMVIGLIFVGFIAFGKEFIVLWAGEVNKEAYVVALLLMAVQLFILSKSVGSQILWALNQHREQAVLKFMIVVLNVFLTIALISWNPLIGATIGTFVSLFIGDVILMDVLLFKKIHLSPKKYYLGLLKGIFPGLLIALVSGFLFKAIVPISGWVDLILGIVILTLVYLVVLFLFGLNEYEKKVLKSIVEYIKNHMKNEMIS